MGDKVTIVNGGSAGGDEGGIVLGVDENVGTVGDASEKGAGVSSVGGWAV